MCNIKDSKLTQEQDTTNVLNTRGNLPTGTPHTLMALIVSQLKKREIYHIYTQQKGTIAYVSTEREEHSH